MISKFSMVFIVLCFSSFAYSQTPEEDDILKSLREHLQGQLNNPTTSEKDKALIRDKIKRLESGKPYFTKAESMKAAGYKVQKGVFKNYELGYQVDVPPDLELQVHQNGKFVIVGDVGTIFAVWFHENDSEKNIQDKLVQNFNRWCKDYPSCEKNFPSYKKGGFKLVKFRQGAFEGYKGLPEGFPEGSGSRFYVFRSKHPNYYFGFNLPPDIADKLVRSLDRPK